jgi:hypothetical protein
MTGNAAVQAGFTLEVQAESDYHTLSLLVRRGTDYDDKFEAWDTDGQEFIKVNG